MNHSIIALTLLISSLGLTACGGSGSDHPTASQAVAEIATPYCGRLGSCLGSSFDQAGCVQGMKGSVPASQANQSDACTNDEVDTCVKDIGSMSCPTGSTAAALMAVLPASCKNC